MLEPLKLTVIGAGNLAHHLVPALHNIGYKISQVWSRTLINANALAHKVNTVAIDNLEMIESDSSLYLILVKDDALSSVCEALPPLNPDAIIAHSSGAGSIAVLEHLTDHWGCFYPLQSFRKNQASRLSEVPFLVNGNDEHTIRELRILARQLSTRVSNCHDEDRLRYHLSAVFINNFTNHLACLAKDFLQANDLDPKYLDTISRTTFDKIINHDPCESQTGPAIRKDLDLISRHLKLLEGKTSMQDVYRMLSDNIINTYHNSEDENSQ